jgi:hypothetical protein
MLIAMITSSSLWHATEIRRRLSGKGDALARMFSPSTFQRGLEKQWCDTAAFTDLVVIVGNTTWEVMNAKKALKLEWEPIQGYSETITTFTGAKSPKQIPIGLENTSTHSTQMAELGAKTAKVVRRDGDPESAFRNAAQVIERSYSAPFLAHNCLEPMNFFAHVTTEKAELVGPCKHRTMEKVWLPVSVCLWKKWTSDDSVWVVVSETSLGLSCGSRSHFTKNERPYQVDLHT